MFKLLLGIALEAFVAISVAGIILALVIPALNQTGAADRGDATASIVIVGVLVAAVAAAVFRPGSALRRYRER